VGFASKALPLGAAAAFLAGCGYAPSSTVDFSDNGVLMPSARLAFAVGRPGPEAPSHPQDGHAVEITVTAASGHGAQSLGAGDPILLGSQTFNPPVQMSYDFDYSFVHVAYRFRWLPGQARRFGVEGLIGPAFADMNLVARGGGLRATEDVSSVGLGLGGGVFYRLLPGSSLHARVTHFAGLDASADRIELFAAQALGRNVAVRAGWSQWTYDAERESNRSGIRIRFSGPMAGLDVMF